MLGMTPKNSSLNFFSDGYDPAFGVFEGEFFHAVELFFQRQW
jgi:hypothetical protein